MCIVKGCTNEKGHGVMVGDLCSPCHTLITTGTIEPNGKTGMTFIHCLFRHNEVLSKTQELLISTIDNIKKYIKNV